MQFACNKMDYFIGEIVVREAVSIRLSKYIAVFDYVDKALLVLSATSGVVFYSFICYFYWYSSQNSKCKPWLSFAISNGIEKKN